MTFPAWVAPAKGEPATLTEMTEEDLGGEIPIEVTHSSVNYKDAMALAGRPGVIRTFPLIPGIDLVGRTPDGAAIIVTGAGHGEIRHGGYAARARVDEKDLVEVPAEFTPTQAAAIGTAGFTAALAVGTLIDAGVTTDRPLFVTGASGGTGSIAIALLASAGFEVSAVTGRATDQGDYLRTLGAAHVIDRESLVTDRALERAEYAGGIDTVGGAVLAGALPRVADGGKVAAVGMAGGGHLATTVYPFILRGVSLLGINSVTVDRASRLAAWQRLTDHLRPELLDSMTQTVSLTELPTVAGQMLAGRGHGRTVVTVR